VPKAVKKLKANAGDKKMSALDAAAKLLAETGTPMNCQDLIKGMAEKGYWSSPGELTSAATLYSAIIRELKTKRNASVPESREVQVRRQERATLGHRSPRGASPAASSRLRRLSRIPTSLPHLQQKSLAALQVGVAA
jgi:hypothetical protein